MDQSTSVQRVDESQPLLPKKDQQKEETFADLKGYWKSLFASFFISIVAGLNDGSLGTIIPRLKDHYQIPNETVSLLFLFSACGFFLGAGFNGYFVHKLGELKTMYFGSGIMLISYFILSSGPSFHVMSCTMPFIGMGIALLDAAMNVFTANVPMATLMLNILHAVYGVGAMISPLVASMLLEYNFSWRYMYIFLALVGIANIVGITIGFWKVDFDEMKHEDDQPEVILDHSELTKKAIFNRVTIVGAIYILIYAGVEVTLGGWGYTFLKEGRHGDEIVMARVVSGYWAGLAGGRILLGYVSGKYGEKLMIIIFTILIVIASLFMYLSTDIILDSVMLVLNGLLLGPMYPTTISLASKALPRSYHATSIGFIAALGSGGAALFPFLTGQAAGKFGILTMPIAVIMMSISMLILWVFIPSSKPLFAAFH